MPTISCTSCTWTVASSLSSVILARINGLLILNFAADVTILSGSFSGLSLTGTSSTLTLSITANNSGIIFASGFKLQGVLIGVSTGSDVRLSSPTFISNFTYQGLGTLTGDMQMLTSADQLVLSGAIQVSSSSLSGGVGTILLGGTITLVAPITWAPADVILVSGTANFE
jgi:hypothetical protein